MRLNNRFWVALVLMTAMLVFGVATVSANTVMVYVHEAGPAYDDDVTRDYLEGVEDGLMEILFETGVIAFSVGGIHNSAEYQAAPRYFAVNAAQQGGAQILIDVGIHTTGSRNGSLSFEQGVLRVRSIPEGEILRELSLQPKEQAIARGERGFRSGAQLGRDAAGDILALFE